MNLRITFMLIACATLTVSAQKNYEIGIPSDPEHYGYLNDYLPLKEYVDTDRYPNFKLGGATIANTYLSSGLTSGMINTNFAETVPGNAMKMASCVDGNGNMNFGTVTKFVDAVTKAGLDVYGHTLAWHAQQPGSWLRQLIKDRPAEDIPGADIPVYVPFTEKDFRKAQNVGWTADKNQYGFSLSFSDTDGLRIHTTKKCNSWEVQFVSMENILLEKGKTYRMTMTVKGSASGKLHSKLGDWSVGTNKDIPFTSDWKDVTVEYKSQGGSFLLLQCGDFVGDIYIRCIRFEEMKMAKEMSVERRCIVVNTTDKQSSIEDNQFWIVSNSNFKQGNKYELTVDVMADKAATVSTHIHSTPGTYITSNAIGKLSFTTLWNTVRISGSFNRSGKSIAFNLSDCPEANSFYFDNISLKIDGKECVINGDLEGTDVSSFRVKVGAGSIDNPEIQDSITCVVVPTPTPLTQKEVHDTLVWAMDKWISGMMKACGGKVKAWDVVNEAISGGGDDGQGNYPLQHNDGTSNDFFWQDYMGDLEYVRSAVRLARKYGPEDIKLFVNDYNLESDWDGNKKLKSLINWIKKWEADGETYIDGIGSQMHISCYMNESTQNSKKNAITNMLKLMASSGKLVRISEFDMGMVDASGKDVPTGKMTEAMHKRMADFYAWIIKQYLSIIPPEQQWGICFWCPTDSPSNSGWRADTPVGLWTVDYYRKHTYAGVVKGLGGVPTSVEPIISYEQALSNSPGIYSITGSVLPEGVSEESLPHGIYIIDGRKVVK